MGLTPQEKEEIRKAEELAAFERKQAEEWAKRLEER